MRSSDAITDNNTTVMILPDVSLRDRRDNAFALSPAELDALRAQRKRADVKARRAKRVARARAASKKANR